MEQFNSLLDRTRTAADSRNWIDLCESVRGSSFVPSNLIRSVLAIEISQTSPILRFAEDLISRVLLLLFVWLGMPLFNLSVGVCQIRFSTALAAREFEYSVDGMWIRFDPAVDRTEVRNYLLSLLSPEHNLDICANYLGLLIKEYAQSNSSIQLDGLIRFIARRYVGSLGDSAHSIFIETVYAALLLELMGDAVSVKVIQRK